MILSVEGYLQGIQGDKTINLMKPHLIDKTVNYLHLTDEMVKSRETPDTSPKVLKRHYRSEPHVGYFDYIPVIGKLKYLEKVSQMYIAYIVHQC